MAKAHKKYTDLCINLELTLTEAFTLYVVTRLVGGSQDSSLRKYTDSIVKSLKDVGIGFDFTEKGLVQPNNRAIYFQDNTINFIDGLVQKYKEYL